MTASVAPNERNSKNRITILDYDSLGRNMRLLLSFALVLPLIAFADSYVATIEKVSGTVGFYSEAGQNEGRVKVGAFPHEAVLSKDGRLLYVSNNGVLWMTEDTMGTNSLSVVD